MTAPDTGMGSAEARGAAWESPADREARNPFFRYSMRIGLPTLLSLLVHVGVLGFLAVKTFDVLRPAVEAPSDYEATVTESLADQMTKAFHWDALDPLAAPLELAPDATLDDLTSINIPDLKPSDLDARAAGGGSGTGGLGIGDGPLALLGTGTGAGEAGTGGFGSGLGGGELGAAGLWDLRIRANKIVYVVDFSGSIIVAVDELKNELKKSIGALRPSQQFTVIIFYSTGAGADERVRTESFKLELVSATEENRRAFFDWIDRKAPRGATEPLEALQRAIDLRPDAIFFFSDGYFEDAVVTAITRANRAARAQIYGLVFDELLLQDTSAMPRETEGSRRLKQIAEANNGRVYVVTGRDLRR